MSRGRFAATDWLDLALAELSAHGPDAVKLDAICAAAKLTRGSFYHHFKDHDRFLVAIARRWQAVHTTDIVNRFEGREPDAATIDSLNDAVIAIDYRLELGIREIARRRSAVADVVREADRARLDLLTTLYTARFGLDRKRAQRFALLEYAALAGLILIDPEMPQDEQRVLAGAYDAMVTDHLGRQ
ncbi:MAG: helix-turn-helix domain-containing protein [Pseudomonadota bacterium]